MSKTKNRFWVMVLLLITASTVACVSDNNSDLPTPLAKIQAADDDEAVLKDKEKAEEEDEVQETEDKDKDKEIEIQDEEEKEKEDKEEDESQPEKATDPSSSRRHIQKEADSDKKTKDAKEATTGADAEFFLKETSTDNTEKLIFIDQASGESIWEAEKFNVFSALEKGVEKTLFVLGNNLYISKKVKDLFSLGLPAPDAALEQFWNTIKNKKSIKEAKAKK